MRRSPNRCRLPSGHVFWLLFGALTLCSCGEPLPETEGAAVQPDLPGEAPGGYTVQLDVEPSAPLDRVSRVLRFRLSLPVELNHPERLLLFSGTLSDYHLRRIQKEDLPSTLLERRIASTTWRSGPGSMVSAPAVRLDAAAVYSVALSGLGLVAEFVTTAEPVAYAERFWPPAGVGRSADHVVFCGAALLVDEAPVLLDPLKVAVIARPTTGLGGAGVDCWHWESAELRGPQVLLPPPHLMGIEIDPAPLLHDPLPPPPLATCLPGELQFGSACATVGDDRISLRNPGLSALWWLGTDAAEWLVPLLGGQSQVFKGLEPERDYSFRFEMVDASGHAADGFVDARTREPRAHVVINEVLANPLGVEPTQEWVELVNDGSTPVDLSAFLLADSLGEVALPAFTLDPGAFVIVAAEGYTPTAGTDIAPTAGAPVLRVSSIGKNGLSNSGERVELLHLQHGLVSAFPARATKAGVSVARREPSTGDTEPDGFALHGPPGASPGSANILSD